MSKRVPSKRVPIKIETDRIARGNRSAMYLPPKSIEEIDQLADNMVQWIYSMEDIFNIAEFPISLRISPYRFYKCADKSEYFAHALELTKYVVAARILRGWREGKLNKDYATKELFRYDPEFKKEYLEAWVLRQPRAFGSDGGASANFVVEIPAIPDSPKVKKIEK